MASAPRRRQQGTALCAQGARFVSFQSFLAKHQGTTLYISNVLSRKGGRQKKRIRSVNHAKHIKTTRGKRRKMKVTAMTFPRPPTGHAACPPVWLRLSCDAWMLTLEPSMGPPQAEPSHADQVRAYIHRWRGHHKVRMKVRFTSGLSKTADRTRDGDISFTRVNPVEAPGTACWRRRCPTT